MKKLSKPMNKQNNVQLYGIDRYDANMNVVANYRTCTDKKTYWSCNWY